MDQTVTTALGIPTLPKINTQEESYLLDYEKIFNKDTIYDFFTKYRFIILLWAVTAIMDAWSTTLFMQFTGPEAELNALTRGCAHSMGITAGPYVAAVLKFVLALPLLLVLRKFAYSILLLATAGQIYAVFANVDCYNTFLYLAAIVG